MAVRLGKIELVGIQSLVTEESRTLVEQRVPEQQGSVFQDLGRDPITLVLDGLLVGDDAQDILEQLRQAQEKADPLAFASDIAVGSELTDVIIEDLKASQVAGYVNRYRFNLRLREYVAPPKPSGIDVQPVKEAIVADATRWETFSAALTAMLEDPTTLMAAMAEIPEFLANLDTDDLAWSIVNNLGTLEGSELVNLFSALSGVDTVKADAVLKGLATAGQLRDVLNKMLAVDEAQLGDLTELLDTLDISATDLITTLGIETLINNKALLAALNMQELGAALADNLSAILPEQWNSLFEATGISAVELLQGLQAAGGLETLLTQFLSADVAVLDRFKTILTSLQPAEIADLFLTNLAVLQDAYALGNQAQSINELLGNMLDVPLTSALDAWHTITAALTAEQLSVESILTSVTDLATLGGQTSNPLAVLLANSMTWVQKLQAILEQSPGALFEALCGANPYLQGITGILATLRATLVQLSDWLNGQVNTLVMQDAALAASTVVPAITSELTTIIADPTVDQGNSALKFKRLQPSLETILRELTAAETQINPIASTHNQLHLASILRIAHSQFAQVQQLLQALEAVNSSGAATS